MSFVVRAATWAGADGVKLEYEVSGDGAAITGCALSGNFRGRLGIPAGLGSHPVKRIGDRAFVGCAGLTSVTIPAGVTTIGDFAFKDCKGLKSVTIPGSVTEIGDEAFKSCSNLQSMTISAGVTAIDLSVIGDRSGLRTLVIPMGLTASNRDGVHPNENGDLDGEGTWCELRELTVIVDGGEEPKPSEPEPGEGGLAASYGPFVPGEAVSLDVPALVGYKAKGLPSGLKLDAKTGRIAGAAKKPTGEAGVMAMFTKKGEEPQTARFVVGPLPAVSVAPAGDAAGCRVTSAGKVCLVGKRGTLAAKAPKGTAFVGWTRDGAPWPDAEAARQAKLSFVMPAEDVASVRAAELTAHLKAGDIAVADRAYTDFGFMDGLDARGVRFVTRQKRNMKMKVAKRLMDPAASTGRKTTQTLAEEIVVPERKSTAGKYRGTLRRVTAMVEMQGRMKTMAFLTNGLKWSARTVAETCRDRWGIETFFKEPRQTCQIHDFIGYSENAVQWQVWTGLLAHLLPRYFAYLSKWGLSFSRLAALVRGVLRNRRRLVETLRPYGTAGPVKTPAAKPKRLVFKLVLDFAPAGMGQQMC